MQLNPEWRFDSPGLLPRIAVNAFNELVGRIVAQGNRKAILEHFKKHFGVTSPSSSESWAESDLYDAMVATSKNAPLFLEAFFEACEALRQYPDFALPDLNRMNRILVENETGYEIRPPVILAVGIHQPIAAPERIKSLDQQARELISKSLELSDRLLTENRPKSAVQEVLWLLETVVTAFRGLSADGKTIEEKYFNKIAGELRRHKKGTALEQVLSWIADLHGYLSSPTGGGVRHGVDLKGGIVPDAAEARLYCNLVRSYIVFLISEHEKLSGSQGAAT